MVDDLVGGLALFAPRKFEQVRADFFGTVYLGEYKPGRFEAGSEFAQPHQPLFQFSFFASHNHGPSLSGCRGSAPQEEVVPMRLGQIH